MMKKLFLLFVTLLLVACGGGPGGGPATSTPLTPATPEAGQPVDNTPQLARELNVINWPDYIAEEVLAQYEEQYGVRIVYDNFASNEDLLAKMQAGATGYDVIFPSDYMVAQMIELGMLAEIDLARIPNFANTDEDFRDAPFDPGNRHCIPYQWGTTGIAYRAGHPFFEENPPDSWAYLFDPELLQQYSAGGINVLDDQRELMAAALLYLGLPLNSTDRAELEQARDVIMRAKPYWKTFNSSDYDYNLLATDEVVLSHSWSGDAANAAQITDGNWQYAIPKEGAVVWLDNACIPASSSRYDTALHFLNYLLDPQVGAAITNFTYFASPNEAALPYIDEEITSDPGTYPPEEVMRKLDWLYDVGDAIFIYDEMWTQIKG
jgi:spermidine/putrescine-binding protein